MAGGRSAEDRRADCPGSAAAAAGPAAGGDSHADDDLGTADYHHVDHDYAAASPAAAAVLTRIAVQPFELPEFRGAQRRSDVLLRPGRDIARLVRGVAGAGAPVGDRPDDCVRLELLAVAGLCTRAYLAWAARLFRRYLELRLVSSVTSRL